MCLQNVGVRFFCMLRGAARFLVSSLWAASDVYEFSVQSLGVQGFGVQSAGARVLVQSFGPDFWSQVLVHILVGRRLVARVWVYNVFVSRGSVLRFGPHL